MESSSPSPAPPATAAVAVTGRGRSLSRENSAKSMVTDQISQAVLSTSNLIRIMLQSSSSQDNLVKLPKTLLAKASTIKNTQQVLEHMPSVISSLDAYMDNGLQSVSHLETVTQLLRNIENNQLKPLTADQVLIEVNMHIDASSIIVDRMNPMLFTSLLDMVSTGELSFFLSDYLFLSRNLNPTPVR
ncbi:hypothetical protein SSX86_025274 [Deinandra increscens subsp. villosa]|uniref:BLOC-1-related complex subunit 7 n=1 Tax=Deinandra increscens subsp. villosa TaxID=3103831 RepID=A0AAP0GLW4_9ASTR